MRKTPVERSRAMKKPVPEDFGMTWVQYLNAVAAVEVERRRRRKVCNRWIAILMLLAWPLAIGAAGYFSNQGMGGLGVLVLLGTLVGTACISVVLPDFYLSRESSSIALMRQTICRYEEAIRRYEHSQQDYWKSLRGTEFERALAGLYKRMGYSVRQTKTSGDEGIDLILVKERTKTIVQCKGHNKPIGAGVARELYGAMMHFGADSAVLACPAGFTKGVRQFVRGKPIQLVSASEIVKMEVSQEE